MQAAPKLKLHDWAPVIELVKGIGSGPSFHIPTRAPMEAIVNNRVSELIYGLLPIENGDRIGLASLPCERCGRDEVRWR